MAENSYPNNVVAAGASCYMYSSYIFLQKIIHSLISSTDKKLEIVSSSGTLTKSVDELHARLVDSGGRCTFHNENSGEYAYVWDGSLIVLHFHKKNNTVSMDGWITDPSLVAIFKALAKEFLSKIKTNLVFSIIQNSTGSLSIRNMGDGSTPLIKDNYHPEVIEDLEYVTASFKKTPPAGRICILNGDPGTGKTHLIRSFLSQIDCVFLIVPSNLIAQLDNPQFLPLLLQVRDDHEKPIIMIIEDGDTCLVPRKSDNISSVAALLNLSDGILGSIMDIKMIISTNAHIKDMDEAIMRVGRLCKQINVGPLEYEQANRVFHRISGDESISMPYRKFYTLAEIYGFNISKDVTTSAAAGRSNGAAKQVIGFRSQADLTVNSVKG